MGKTRTAKPKTLTRGDLNFVLYARKSTEEGDKQIHSIEDQITECREYAERCGDINIVEIIREEKSARYSHNRKQFDTMIEGIKSGKYDAIISWHPDRLSRNMLEAGIILDMLTPAKDSDEPLLKDLVFPRTPFTNDSSNRLTLAVLFSLATQYSEHLSESVSRGHTRNLLSRGVSAGIYKWGYKTSETTRQYIPDDNYDLIKKGWQMILDGKSQTEVREFWTKQGVKRIHKTKVDGSQKAPVAPNKDVVNRIFHDPFYYGLLQQAGNSVNLIESGIQKDFKPMVTEEEWNRVQDILDGRYQTHRHRTDSTVYLPLKGIVFCGVCGSKMYPGASGSRKGVKRKTIYYTCQNPKCTRKKRGIRGYIIFDQIVEALNKMKLSKNAYDEYKKALEKYLEEEVVELKNQRASLVAIRSNRKRELEAENRQYVHLVDPKNKTPKSTLKSAREHIKELEGIIYDLDKDVQELDSLIKDPTSITLTKEDFLNLIQNGGRIVESGSFAEKDAIIRKLFLNIEIDDKNKASYLLKPELEGLIDGNNFSYGGSDWT